MKRCNFTKKEGFCCDNPSCQVIPYSCVDFEGNHIHCETCNADCYECEIVIDEGD